MKVFFIDIDGVIYKEGKINRKVINIIKQKQSKIVYCTGRGYLRALDIIKDSLDNDSILIVENGSKIVDTSGKNLYFKNISQQDKNIIKNIDYNQIEYAIFNPNDKKTYISYSKKKLEHVELNCNSYQTFCVEMNKSDITQITIKFNNKIYQKEFIMLCENSGINYKISEDYVIINRNLISKKSAILYYLNRFNVNCSDIVIIGNDYNDLDMFDLECKNKIVVVDKYTPKSLIKKANIVTNFEELESIIEKIF